MDKTISTLIKRAITKNPQALAFTGKSDSEKITFAQYDERAARINAYILSRGLKKGDCIAVLLDRNADYLIVQSAGLIYGYKIVLLDVHYPEDRLNYILENAGVKLVIDDEIIEEAYKMEPDFTIPELTEDDDAVATYTSGSTGKPKGVLHDQGSLAHCVYRYTVLPDELGSNIAGLIAPFTFIAGVWMYLTVLCRSWTSVIIPMEVVKNPRKLPEFLAEYDVSYTYMPPRILKNFKQVKQTLKAVITGSEKLSNIYNSEFRIINCYGMTETAATVVTFDIDRLYENVPSGKPLPFSGAYICDENLKETEVGEICLTGRFLKEYIGLPEETAAKKIPNPFKDRDGCDWLYRTTDLGQRLPDGNIQYLNRMDWMIKINGQRIEPGEIEAVMKSIPGVTDAICKDFTRHDRTYICGFYIAEDSVTKETFLNVLKQKLPDYMIPSFFTKMDKFPVNANGKLDRFALPDPKM